LREAPDSCPICARGEPLDVLADFLATWITAGEEAPLPGYACVVSKIHVTRPIDPRNPQFKRTTDDLARMRTALLDALVA